MTDLPSPGALRNSVALQREARAALSRVISDAAASPSLQHKADELRAFFKACADACPTASKGTKK